MIPATNIGTIYRLCWVRFSSIPCSFWWGGQRTRGDDESCYEKEI